MKWKSPSLSSRKLRLTVFVILQVGFIACKKHEVPEPPAPIEHYDEEVKAGLPASLDSLHGYLCAENFFLVQSSPPYQYKAIRLAMFAESGIPLLEDYTHHSPSIPSSNKTSGNISLGEVQYCDRMVNEIHTPPHFNYYTHQQSGYIYEQPPAWEVEGNKSIPGFTIGLPDGMPVILDSLSHPTLSLTASWSVNVTKFCSNYDSVDIELKHMYTNSSLVHRAVAFPDSVITFTKQEISIIASPYPRITIRAFRYLHTRRKGRLYLFELIRKKEQTIPGQP